MSNIKTFFEECLTLPWKPNPQNNPQHENQVEKLLIKHGIKYVYQPNGKQKPPDFKILHDKVYDPYFKCDGWKSSISVECKSSKQVYPTYNSTLPQKETVYIFSSQKYNETTIFFGGDIVDDVKREMYNQYLIEQEELLQKHRRLVGWHDPSRGFDFYNREMYIQQGKNGEKNYFSHFDRERCEQNVLDKMENAK